LRHIDTKKLTTLTTWFATAALQLRYSGDVFNLSLISFVVKTKKKFACKKFSCSLQRRYSGALFFLLELYLLF